jgi:peptidyl-prolyl cis-trans isomerase C
MKNRNITHALAPALILGLLFFSCTKKEEEKSPGPGGSGLPETTVVATVNGDPITLGEFLERFTRAGFKPDSDIDRSVKEEFLNRLIERKMMLREAQRKRIKIGLPEINQRIDALRKEHGKDVKEELAAQGIDFEKWKNEIWENMMIEKLVGREVDRHVSVSPAEVRRYYQANHESFTRPEQVRVRQIVVSTEAEARNVLEQVLRGTDFATLAREKSTAPEAVNGGDLGYFALGEMPPEFNVVFSLHKGGVSGVVKSPYGFHVFKLEDRRPAGTRGLDEVSEDIARVLSQEKQEARFRQWMKELRSRTKFEVNYQALAR